MTKFMKTLIIINGILIPLIIIISVVSIVINLHQSSNNGTNEGVFTDNVIQKDTGLIQLQGVDYSIPEKIAGTNIYCLKIAIKTFDKPKNLGIKIGSIVPSLKSSAEYNQFVNIVFLDKNYNVIQTLLNRKASIIDVEAPDISTVDGVDKIDKSVQNLAYLIVFMDTNKDGVLDDKDNSDLYISDIKGQGLTCILKNKDIQSLNFIDSNSKLLISYKEKTNSSKEYIYDKFAIYDFKVKDLRMLNGISTEIGRVEKILKQNN
jgi:hypothetical protein